MASLKLGATAKKGDFIEDGEAYYVHPGATKKQREIALEDCYQISAEYFEANRRGAGLRPDDIINNRSSEAHGKVAYWDNPEPAVASDFTMRVRVNADANSRFMWYFFRSVMFQAQIFREIMGASIHNVFPSQVEQMFVVECKKKRQDTIADRIGAELAKVRTALSLIESKRQKILSVIEKAVYGNRCPGRQIV